MAEGHATAGVRLRWEAVDLAFFGYTIFVVTLLLVFGVGLGHVDRPWAMVALHLGVAVAALGLRASILVRENALTRFLRWWYPLLLLFLYFQAIGGIITLIHPQMLDALLVRAERAIFGFLWTPWMQQYATPLLTEFFYICYVSYYFFLPGVGIPLYLRARGDSYGPAGTLFREFIFAATLTFLFCYVHFFFTPAGGPIYYPDYPSPVLSPPGGPITLIERWLFEHGGMVGGAFPSSHVAVGMVATGYAVRERVAPRLFVPLFIGLAVSTLYHGYHYGVDVLWGMVVASVMLLAAPRLFGRWERRMASEEMVGDEGLEPPTSAM